MLPWEDGTRHSRHVYDLSGLVPRTHLVCTRYVPDRPQYTWHALWVTVYVVKQQGSLESFPVFPLLPNTELLPTVTNADV